ncbi:MAG: hypothetical protein V4723_17765 [Pseudomonadota bacterium]
MKLICMLVVVASLSVGCASTEQTVAEKQALAEYSEGYAPTGTNIKRKSVIHGMEVSVLDKQQLENQQRTGAGEIAPPPK